MTKELFKVTKELLEAIQNSSCTNRVLVWSACAKTDNIIEELQKNDIEVCGYIDSRADEIKTFNGLNVYNKNIIKKTNILCTLDWKVFTLALLNL